MKTPKQIGPERQFDLADLDGRLVAWHVDQDHPVIISFGDQKVVPIFNTIETLTAVMAHIHVDHYTIEKIESAPAFVASVKSNGYECAFNVHVGPKHPDVDIAPLRYTLVKWSPQ